MTKGSVPRRPPAAATQLLRNELLAKLTNLLPAQFDEVLFRTKLPPEHMSASSSPQSTRAIETIRYLEQQNRLPELACAISYVVSWRDSTSSGPKANTAGTQARTPKRVAHRSQGTTSLVIAAAAGAVALLLLVVMLSSAQLLIRVGLTGHIWYVLLLLLGLFAAVTVFSLSRSYTRSRGNARTEKLALSGPVVVVLAVIVLGFYLIPSPPQRFDVTVFFHGTAGRQAVVLRNRGKVSLELGPDKRIEAVGDKGEVRFAGVPGDMRDREVTLGLDDEAYELVKSELTIRLNQEPIYAAVQPKRLLLIGYVSDEHGRPLPQTRAVIAKATGMTDQDGRFEIELPADLPERDHSIVITATGYEIWRGQVAPGGDPLRVQLSPSSDGM